MENDLAEVKEPNLNDILSACEDKNQGYTAYNLLRRFYKKYNYEHINWKFDPSLNMIIVEVLHKGKAKVFVPLYFTYSPTPKWIRETVVHLKELVPQRSVHLAFSTSSQIFAIYRTNNTLELPKNMKCEELRKSQAKEEESLTTDET